MRAVHASLLAGLVATLVSPTYAGLYVVHPLEKDSCKAGGPCVLEWLDDGESPLLSNIGPCTVGLYHGELKLVQTIAPVDISATHTLTFTPNADAGPNGFYYVAFTSAGLRNTSDASRPYMAFTPAFRLTGMSGSFSDPVPTLTRTSSIPSTVAAPSDTSIVSTTTVGPPITDIPTFASSADLTSPSSPSSPPAAETSSTASPAGSPSTSGSPSKSTSASGASTTATTPAPASASSVSGAPSGKPTSSGFLTSLSTSASSSAPPAASSPSGNIPTSGTAPASSPSPTSNAAAMVALPARWTVLSLFVSMMFAL